MIKTNSLRFFCSILLISILLLGRAQAQQEYGYTDFEASGSREAHQVFLRGLLQLHNFEYGDARASFQEAQSIDSNFVMAYWGEALTYEHSFWGRFDIEAAKATLARLGGTPEERASKAETQRERDYLNTLEVLFSEGTQEEREIRYSHSLQELHEKYPNDLDAAAFYALSILFTTYGGRDFTRYMKAASITEEILDKNPLHPGALHYNIHSYDDPIHASLGLRAARDYFKVAPSAIHALHMGSHIYFALGMWEEGTDRNARSFGEAVARQKNPTDLYSGQAYHALTWLIYSLSQQGEYDSAEDQLALIETQVDQYGDANIGPRRAYVGARAAYIIDTQQWQNHHASVVIKHDGLNDFSIATDYYLQGIVALNHGDAAGAENALDKMGGEEEILSADREIMAPRLLRLALQGQIALAAGRQEEALELIGLAAELEGQLPAEYGPVVPVQPMAELLADTYRSLGDADKARSYYEISLQSAVGRERSLKGLNQVSQ